MLVYTKRVNSQQQQKLICSKPGWKGDYSRARPLCFTNQWIVHDIPSLSSQSERLNGHSLVWYILIVVNLSVLVCHLQQVEYLGFVSQRYIISNTIPNTAIIATYKPVSKIMRSS